MNKTNQLLQLKEQIEEAKTKASELKGRRDGLMKELKDDWDCASLNQADKKIKELEQEIKQLSDKIAKGISEIEEKYEL